MRIPAIAAIVLVAACEGPGNRPDEWSYIQAAILQPSCATVNCHSTAVQRFGLDFEDKTRCQDIVSAVVVPGDLENSPLIYRLRGPADLLMPPDAPLPEAEIQIIESWVLDGAPCD
jgi:hypothetical protein